jgi:hypothetical protein
VGVRKKKNVAVGKKKKKETAISGRPGLRNNWVDIDAWCDSSYVMVRFKLKKAIS